MISLRTFSAVVAAVVLSPTVALADPGVRVMNAAARMEVIPEARSDYRIDIRPGDPRLPAPAARREGAVIVVDGGLHDRIAGCGTYNSGLFGGGRDHVVRVNIRGIGWVALDRLPVITAHVPLDAGVSAGDAVYGHVGRSDRLGLANSGCGDWTVDDVKRDLAVANSGSGDIRTGQAGAMHAALSGSGDLTSADVLGGLDLVVHGSADAKVGRVGGPLHVDLAGSGDLRAREVAGPVQSQQSGSGDVEIDGGRAPSVQVHTSGSGDFVFHGDAGSVAAASSGSGDITIAHASGPVEQAHSGSGEVHIGR